MELHNERHALVTGASSGLGREIAIRLAKDGYTVILSGRCLERLKDVQQKIEEEGGKASVLQADVKNDKLLKEKVKTFLSGKKIEILVNSAGIVYLEGRSSNSGKELEKVNEISLVNYHGAINVVNAALPHIKEGGSIVMILSVAAILDFGKILKTYSHSKRELQKAIISLRPLLRERNIHINLAYPPIILDTPMARGLGLKEKLPPIYRVFKWHNAKDMANAIVDDLKFRREESYLDKRQRILAAFAKRAPKTFSWSIRIYARLNITCKYIYKKGKTFFQKFTQK